MLCEVLGTAEQSRAQYSYSTVQSSAVQYSTICAVRCSLDSRPDHRAVKLRQSTGLIVTGGFKRRCHLLQGPFGDHAHAMYVGPGSYSEWVQALPAGVFPSVHSVQTDNGFAPSAVAVQYITHSPVGALTSLGSCENTGHTSELLPLLLLVSFRRKVSPPSVETACTTWELVVQASIPQCANITFGVCIHDCTIARLALPFRMSAREREREREGELRARREEMREPVKGRGRGRDSEREKHEGRGPRLNTYGRSTKAGR